MAHPLPKYDNPPINEVVFGATFAPLANLKAPHLGLFWNEVKSEFVRCEHAPPVGSLNDIIEPESGVPLPRVWFINAEDDHLLQIQKNKFLLNWRKRENVYPHFEDISEKFYLYFGMFQESLEVNDVGQVNILELELSYINIIPKGEGWDSVEKVKDLFPDLSMEYVGDRFLSSPDSINWQTTFKSDKLGNRFIKSQFAKRIIDGHPLINLEIGVRGNSNDVKGWFNEARE